MHLLKVARKRYSDQRDSIVQDQTVHGNERGYEGEKYPKIPASVLFSILF